MPSIELDFFESVQGFLSEESTSIRSSGERKRRDASLKFQPVFYRRNFTATVGPKLDPASLNSSQRPLPAQLLRRAPFLTGSTDCGKAHRAQSNKNAITTGFCRMHWNVHAYFGGGAGVGVVVGVVDGDAVGAGGGVPIGATSTAFAEGGNLSALATSSAICHICVSLSDLLKPGMPLRRMPLNISNSLRRAHRRLRLFLRRARAGADYIPVAIAVLE